MLNLIFLYVIYLMTCRCLHGGVPRISGAGNTWWTSGVTPSGRRCTMLDGRGLCWCQVHYTIKVTLHSLNMLLDGYTNLCLYSNTQYCIISNHVAFFCSRRHMVASLHPVQGMGFGPQGQGDDPQPPQWLHIDGKGCPCARVRSEHPGPWWRNRHESGRRQKHRRY